MDGKNITFGGYYTTEILRGIHEADIEEYIILSYDSNEGAKVEIKDDFYLSLMPTESVIKIKLSTKYDWQFEERMKEFSVIEFIQKLIK